MVLPRRRLKYAALAALGACSGCWEEVQFTPPPEVQAAADTPPAETPPADAVVLEEPAAAPPPSEPVVLEAPATDPPPSDEPVTLPDPPATAPPDPVESVAPTLTTPPSTPPSPMVSNERSQAWRAASQWSLAAAMSAKGLAAERYDPVLAEANGAAAAIGLELPPLPASATDAVREQAVVESLRDDAGPALAATIGERLGAADRAAAELVIQSRLWLLTYTPQSRSAIAEAAAARKAGVASDLPAELWAPLVQLVEARAEFLDVRQAVFDMVRRVEAHLKKQP